MIMPRYMVFGASVLTDAKSFYLVLGGCGWEWKKNKKSMPWLIDIKKKNFEANEQKRNLELLYQNLGFLLSNL